MISSISVFSSHIYFFILFLLCLFLFLIVFLSITYLLSIKSINQSINQSIYQSINQSTFSPDGPINPIDDRYDDMYDNILLPKVMVHKGNKSSDNHGITTTSFIPLSTNHFKKFRFIYYKYSREHPNGRLVTQLRPLKQNEKLTVKRFAMSCTDNS